MDTLEKLLIKFQDYGIGVQYFSADFAETMLEKEGWCSTATINSEAIFASGYNSPIDAVTQCIKTLKLKKLKKIELNGSRNM